MRSVPVLLALISIGGFAVPARAADSVSKLDAKLNDAGAAYRELMDSPDRGVPQSLREDCHCVAVIPGAIQGALGIGARAGRGAVSCRGSGGWSPPSFLRLTGGSFGFQIGGERTDVVLFFMTERSAHSLLDSKFTLGGQASVAAGPVGRSGEANTDLKLTAEIYSYAKSKGLFAGVSLEGARLSTDDDANAIYYGARIPANEILFEHKVPRLPKSGEKFRDALK